MRIEREMAPLSTIDIAVGLGAIAVAAIAIYLFIRASSGKSKAEPGEAVEAGKEMIPSPPSVVPFRNGGFQMPDVEHHLSQSEVDRARSRIRTLTLQSELFSMMLKRLFEAEDDGEITREERLSLSKGYEADLKRISRDLKRSELIVSLHELESIRDDILKRFTDTLNSTQNRIDAILRELKLEEKKKAPPRAPSRRKPAKKEEKEAPEEAEEAKPPKPRSDVEAKLEQLRKEVLKELEELDKLEFEV